VSYKALFGHVWPQIRSVLQKADVDKSIIAKLDAIIKDDSPIQMLSNLKLDNPTELPPISVTNTGNSQTAIYAKHANGDKTSLGNGGMSVAVGGKRYDLPAALPEADQSSGSTNYTPKSGIDSDNLSYEPYNVGTGDIIDTKVERGTSHIHIEGVLIEDLNAASEDGTPSRAKIIVESVVSDKHQGTSYEQTITNRSQGFTASVGEKLIAVWMPSAKEYRPLNAANNGGGGGGGDGGDGDGNNVPSNMWSLRKYSVNSTEAALDQRWLTRTWNPESLSWMGQLAQYNSKFPVTEFVPTIHTFSSDEANTAWADLSGNPGIKVMGVSVASGTRVSWNDYEGSMRNGLNQPMVSSSGNYYNGVTIADDGAVWIPDPEVVAANEDTKWDRLTDGVSATNHTSGYDGTYGSVSRLYFVGEPGNHAVGSLYFNTKLGEYVMDSSTLASTPFVRGNPAGKIIYDAFATGGNTYFIEKGSSSSDPWSIMRFNPVSGALSQIIEFDIPAHYSGTAMLVPSGTRYMAFALTVSDGGTKQVSWWEDFGIADGGNEWQGSTSNVQAVGAFSNYITYAWDESNRLMYLGYSSGNVARFNVDDGIVDWVLPLAGTVVAPIKMALSVDTNGNLYVATDPTED